MEAVGGGNEEGREAGEGKEVVQEEGGDQVPVVGIEAGEGREVVRVGRVLPMGGEVVDPSSPFLIFPAEVWKLVLEQLEDSRDVFNMFDIFPELKDLMENSRHLYLFDRAITYLADWINEQALINCRGVCRMWRKGVDDMVQNQPSLRAYDHDSSEPSQNWRQRNYYRSKDMEDPSLVLFRRHFQFRYSFHNQIIIRKFLDGFALHGAGRNPFIGRSVVINRYPWGDNSYITSFWENTLSLLQAFGEHIWFIEIWEFIHQDPYHFVLSVLKSLALLPNLRSLHLEGNMSWATVNDSNTIVIKRYYDVDTPVDIATLDFPLLPHLETLKIGDGFPNLVETLIQRYSPQIRRLVWSTRGWNWQTEYEKCFPNLTELIFVARSVDKERVNDLLHSLEAPQLYRLYLGFRGEPAVKYTKEEIGAWMRRFPHLSAQHFRVVSQL